VTQEQSEAVEQPRGRVSRTFAAPGRADRDRQLVSAIRGELSAIAPSRRCCRAAERAGLGEAAAGRAPTASVARLAVRLDELDGPPAVVTVPFAWPVSADHCRMAWLRGVFLSRGSLSVATGRVHLEFVLPPDAAQELAGRLAEIGLPAALRTRRGAGVVTWKGLDPILTFLRRIGASSSLLELDARLVTRSLRADLNRIVNAETANLRRSVAASARQRQAIERLVATGRVAAERLPIRAVAMARLAAPDASLGDLATETGLSRSLVQRALDRLQMLADDDRSERGHPDGVPPDAAGASRPRGAGTRSAHDGVR
jgi:cell division protein WhiA